jgi:hypothetical protein
MGFAALRGNALRQNISTRQKEKRTKIFLCFSLGLRLFFETPRRRAMVAAARNAFPLDRQE